MLEFFASLDLVINEVYGQSEDTGPTTFNLPGRTRFGTVGQRIDGVEVEISTAEENKDEIVVRGRNVFLGYYKDPAATAEALKDGWLQSGDLGAFDGEGFLTITGRSKDILITAGGAAFGQIMKETGIAEELEDWLDGPGAGGRILIVAFVLTALVRMAQGSATVSMMTCGALMASLLENVELTFHPVYLALAIGCGSKPGPWMNDSGFWVISRMSGMTEGETLKTFSVMLTLMGISGFVVVWIASRLMPMV